MPRHRIFANGVYVGMLLGMIALVVFLSVDIPHWLYFASAVVTGATINVVSKRLFGE